MRQAFDQAAKASFGEALRLLGFGALQCALCDRTHLGLLVLHDTLVGAGAQELHAPREWRADDDEGGFTRFPLGDSQRVQDVEGGHRGGDDPVPPAGEQLRAQRARGFDAHPGGAIPALTQRLGERAGIEIGFGDEEQVQLLRVGRACTPGERHVREYRRRSPATQSGKVLTSRARDHRGRRCPGLEGGSRSSAQ